MDEPSRRAAPQQRAIESLGRMVVSRPASEPALPIEPELCEQLGVSRGVLREAMKSLVGKGLVEVRPRAGTRVRPRHLWNNLDPDVLRWSAEIDRERTVIELNELRRAVEPTAATLAAMHADPAQVSLIWRQYFRMEDAASRGDLDGFIEADTQFHEAVLGAGGNELFRSLGHAIDAVLRESFRATATEIEDVTSSLPLHRAVAASISSRMPGEAGEAMLGVIGATVRRIGQDRQGVNAVALAQNPMTAPPSTGRQTPVTKLAAGLDR